MQQKQFRIEKMLTKGRGATVVVTDDAAIAVRRNLAALVADGDGRRLTRAAAELGAVMESMEKAAQVVLAAAESIDDGVRTIADQAASDARCAIAPDIRHRVSQIYEACNFQDLAGQRIGKVIALLAHIEEQLSQVIADEAAAPAPAGPAREDGLINGPRLDGAAGHVDQRAVDALFG